MKEIIIAGGVTIFFMIVALLLKEAPSIFECLIVYLILANYFTMIKKKGGE